MLGLWQQPPNWSLSFMSPPNHSLYKVIFIKWRGDTALILLLEWCPDTMDWRVGSFVTFLLLSFQSCLSRLFMFFFQIHYFFSDSMLSQVSAFWGIPPPLEFSPPFHLSKQILLTLSNSLIQILQAEYSLGANVILAPFRTAFSTLHPINWCLLFFFLKKVRIVSHSQVWGLGNPYHRGTILGNDANEVSQEESMDWREHQAENGDPRKTSFHRVSRGEAPTNRD